jgi:hypothetical protein
MIRLSRSAPLRALVASTRLASLAVASTVAVALAGCGDEAKPTNDPIVVGGENEDGLTIIRGQGAYSYSCVDKCRATPMVGDAPEHFSSTMSTITGKNRTAKGE